MDCNARFIYTCRATNEKLMKGLLAKPTNLQYKEEMLRLLKIPIHLLVRILLHLTNIKSYVVYENAKKVKVLIIWSNFM